MSTEQDPFFEEEAELARAQAQACSAKSKKQPAVRAQPPAGATARKPPSFAMVVAIAAVALVLGVCIGYFIAMSVVDRTSSDTGQVSSSSSGQVAQTARTDSSGADDASMPEGHPDIASMLNSDGTVNQEAVEEYKARAAAASADDGQSDGAQSDSAAE